MANAPHAWDNQGWQDSNNDGTWDTANTGWNASGQAGGGSTALTAPRPQAHADNVGWPSDRQLGASNSGPHAREVTGARTSISGGPTLQAKVNTANRPHACENPSNASNTQPHAWEAGPTSPVKPHAWESTSQSRRTSHAWEGENDNPPSPTRRVYRGPPPPRNDNVRLFDIDEYARELGMLCLHQGEFDIAVSEVPEPYPKIGNPPVLEQMTYADLMQLARRTESGPDLSERQKDEVPRKARNYMRSQRQTDGSRSASPLAQNITDAKRNDSVQGRPNTSYADQMATTALAKGKSKSTEDIDLTVETGDRTGGTFADEMELRKREKETEQRMLEKEMGERKMEKGKFKSTADIISAAAEGDVLKSSDEDVKPVAVRVPPRNDGGLFTPMKAGAAMFPAVELHQSPVASGGAGARPAESAAPTHAGPVQEPRQPAHFDPAIQQCGQLIWNVSQHYIAAPLNPNMFPRTDEAREKVDALWNEVFETIPSGYPLEGIVRHLKDSLDAKGQGTPIPPPPEICQHISSFKGIHMQLRAASLVATPPPPPPMANPFAQPGYGAYGGFGAPAGYANPSLTSQRGRVHR